VVSSYSFLYDDMDVDVYMGIKRDEGVQMKLEWYR